MFFAETLGCQPKEVLQLKAAGFDYLFNSSKWWDFRADWLMKQYALFRAIAPSIAFPESHDTERLAEENGGDERVSRLRYLFAAAFSSGLMLTMGYEYGFRRKLNVVTTRPEDWETPGFDLSRFIGEVNAMKATTPVLNEEGPQELLSGADDPVAALIRRGERTASVLTLINPDANTESRFSTADAAKILGCSPQQMRELLPGPTNSDWITLPPLAIRLFTAD